MSRFTSDDYYKHVVFLKNLTASFGPPHNPTNEICNSYLDDLEQNLDVDNFFWVVNLKEQKVDRSAGVSRYLGYPDNRTRDSNQLTLYDIYAIVHENMQEIIQAQRQKAFPYLFEHLKGKIVPLTNDFIYKVIVCFVKRDGKSILVKQKSTAFQLDKDGNMLSYLSSHEVIRDYKDEAPSVEIFIDKERDTELEEFVEIGVAEIVELPFTPRQIDILKVIADYEENRPPFEDKILSNNDLAGLLNKKLGIEVTENTVYTHKRNIMRIAKEKYGRTFSKIRDLAIFLRKFHLI